MGDTWKKQKPKKEKEQKQMQADLAATQQSVMDTQAALMELASTLSATQTTGGNA